MDIKSIHIRNIGRFSNLDVELAPNENVTGNITIFIGNNGCGKTSILKGAATSLSWFIARVRSEKGSGNPLPEQVILSGENGASVSLKILDDLSSILGGDSLPPGQDIFEWTIAKTRSGKKSKLVSDLSAASRLADFYRSALSENSASSLPLIAFYPVERVVLDVPLKIKGRHNFGQVDGYDNSLSQGVDFRRFFEWFREREDSENESGVTQELLDRLEQSDDPVGQDVWKTLKKLMASSRDRQLTAVRTAINVFMPEFSNLRVRRKPRLHMSIDKGKETLNVLQLSQGEKSLIALVGDIARRLAMMNPSLENPLKGDGVILIDEIDMHLHPSWQREIVERLRSTFPNCQFILSTHSPLVISQCKNVLVYSLDDFNLDEQGVLNPIQSVYGEDANSVLLNVMDTDIRNSSVSESLNNLLTLIQNADSKQKIQMAKELLYSFKNELPHLDLEIAKANILLRKQEIRSEKNH